MPQTTAPTTSISPDTLREVYEEVKTPFKHGVILKGEDKKLVDCPCVFRFNNAWFMLYVCMNKVGYETHLARSNDLVKWEPLGTVLPFRSDDAAWDRWQADGGMALVDFEWNGTHEPKQFDSKYWMSYIGGAKQGYETDPLSIGIAWTKMPDRAVEWNRLPSNPVLTRDDPDTRPFEKETLYKSSVIFDKAETLGHPFVMFYNGKQQGKVRTERIGCAVSEDMVHWSRFGDAPVIDNGPLGISGDPQITKIGDVWVMHYFGHHWTKEDGSAFDTFAVSRDLVNWTRWDGPHLIQPSEPYDMTFAHKPWVLKHDGVVYHYYCAVGEEGRVIALATSKKI